MTTEETGPKISRLSEAELSSLMTERQAFKKKFPQMPREVASPEKEDKERQNTLATPRNQGTEASEDSDFLVEDSYEPESGSETVVVGEDGLSVMPFESSVELVAFFDEAMNSGRHVPHPWQTEISEFLCIQNKPTYKDPLRLAVRAANGSGKDAYVIAPFAIWFALTKKQSLCVITSSSHRQMDEQTEYHIRNLAEAINKKMGSVIFQTKARQVKCALSGSEISMFVTDEPGKAEGSHPRTPDSEMCIIINEAKSVEDDIFQALSRCTGYNYWLEISSPGGKAGRFYKSCLTWKNHIKVTAFDCPHLGEAYIENAKIDWGENSPTYRSMVLAEFSSLEGLNIVKQEWIDRLKERPPKVMFQHWPVRVGIDAGQGSDETVVSAWQGNQRIFQHCFRDKDATIQADILNHTLGTKLKLPKNHPYIWGDDGVGSKATMDILRRMGWKVQGVLNQSKAINRTRFVNRTAELWTKFARLWEEGILQLPDPEDKKFEEQLTGRHYLDKSVEKERLQLETKADARRKGRPSPDRADAAVLAFHDLQLKDFLEELEKEVTGHANRQRQLVSVEDYSTFRDDVRYGQKELKPAKKGQRIYHFHNLIETDLYGNKTR
jgi:hypothetical protein